MYTLSVENSEDWWEVEALYDTCFAPGREALSSYRLRHGVAPVASLSMVARDPDGILAGAIRYWPVIISPVASEERPMPPAATRDEMTALLLGPIAVHPTRQGEGLGGLLMRRSLDQAKLEGWARVLLVGDAPYYRRFGFTRLARVIMPPPTNPERVLGIALRPGAWQGVEGTVEKHRD